MWYLGIGDSLMLMGKMKTRQDHPLLRFTAFDIVLRRPNSSDILSFMPV